MADITMCHGTGCPWKNRCYRFMAKPNEFRQSYYTEVPGKMIDEVFYCESFWAVKEDLNKDIKDILKKGF